MIRLRCTERAYSLSSCLVVQASPAQHAGLRSAVARSLYIPAKLLKATNWGLHNNITIANPLMKHDMCENLQHVALSQGELEKREASSYIIMLCT